MPDASTGKLESEHLLPLEAYTSQAWFDREMAELFARSWLFAALTTDLPEPGDYVAVQAGSDPIVVVRQKDGSLRAFHNLCRHRGVVILEGRGNASSGISCFYHRWHYNVDGSLRGVPQAEQFPQVVQNKASYGLRPASVGEYNGLVFVNAQAEPQESLSDWLDKVPDRWGPWRPTELLELPGSEIEMEANWKLFLENHIDGYHLWHLHSKTVVGYDHAQQDWTACGRHWMFYEPELVKGEMPERRLIKLPVIPGIDASRFGSSVFMLFPNVGGVGGATFFSFFVVYPIGPNRTRVSFRTFIKPLVDQDFVDDPELAEWLENSGSRPLFGSSSPGGDSFSEKLELAGLAGDFVAEDKLAVESIQRAMSSQQFSVGPLAKDFEAAIEFYHVSILNFIKPI